MTAERWAQITAVFRAAAEKPAAERAVFLDQACRSDEPLRRNVERLLSGAAEPTLESPLPEMLKTGALELNSNEMLAQYRLEAKIGEGGMGAVYRAHDTRLQRKVALKVLSPERFADLDRKRRLVREARSASALNHPNIVTIYEVGLDRDIDFIAMEYVEGEALDRLIPPKGMRPAQVFGYAIQVADALAKAHAAGIVHRDLKPSNIMVTSEGRIKLLDFGLAKVLEASDSSPGGTILTEQQLTEQGTVLGTAAYMSPEQAEGREIDTRSDIFSFGSVLYELATGRRPFSGGSRAALLTRIASEDPQPPSDIVQLPADLEKLILRCLPKDPSRRFQSMADLRVALEDFGTETSAPPAPAGSKSRSRFPVRNIAMCLGLILAAAMVLIAARALRRSPEAGSLRTVRFSFTPAQLLRGSNHDIDAEVSISPDGKHIAYVESQDRQLWIRDLDQERARPVPGATRVYQTFWSADARYVGYSEGDCFAFVPGCDLARIPVEGGTPVPIVKLQGGFRRASWSSDGDTILYAEWPHGLFTIPTRGGSPTRLLGHDHLEHPSFLDLPGGKRAFLFQAVDKDRPGGHGIFVLAAGDNQRRFVKMSSSSNPYPIYSPTGHIIYVDGNNESASIWALPFSLSTLQPTGNAFPIAQHGSSPVVSQTGTLVYSDVPSNRMQLLWCDRAGKTLSLIGEPLPQESPSLSPDGRRLVVEGREGNQSDLWVYELDREIKSRTQITFDQATEPTHTWTPLGNEITYSSDRNGNSDIFSKPPDGEPKLLVGTPAPEQAPDWSPDQKYLIYGITSPETRGDLLYRERRPDGSLSEPVIFLKTPFSERLPRFSPDGHFVAYVSNQSGRDEVYVRDFPRGTNQWQISANGGIRPRWRRDGKEIFYVEGQKLMAVSATARPAFSSGIPAQLFEQRHLQQSGYDVSSDGKRFIVLGTPAGQPPLSIHVVQNWFEEFRGREGGLGM